MKFSHDNLVSLKRVYYEAGKLYLQMDLGLKNLGQHKIWCHTKDRPFTESKISSFIKDIAKGLDYMHSLGYIHRDVKPENLILCENDSLKIADFGTSKSFSKEKPNTGYVSTRWY